MKPGFSFLFELMVKWVINAYQLSSTTALLVSLQTVNHPGGYYCPDKFTQRKLGSRGSGPAGARKNSWLFLSPGLRSPVRVCTGLEGVWSVPGRSRPGLAQGFSVRRCHSPRMLGRLLGPMWPGYVSQNPLLRGCLRRAAFIS